MYKTIIDDQVNGVLIESNNRHIKLTVDYYNNGLWVNETTHIVDKFTGRKVLKAYRCASALHSGLGNHPYSGYHPREIAEGLFDSNFSDQKLPSIN